MSGLAAGLLLRAVDQLVARWVLRLVARLLLRLVAGKLGLRFGLLAGKLGLRLGLVNGKLGLRFMLVAGKLGLRVWDNGACLYVVVEPFTDNLHAGDIMTNPRLLLEKTLEITNLHPEQTTLM